MVSIISGLFLPSYIHTNITNPFRFTHVFSKQNIVPRLIIFLNEDVRLSNVLFIFERRLTHSVSIHWYEKNPPPGFCSSFFPFGFFAGDDIR